MWPIPPFSMDGNVVIADKRIQRVYNSYVFIVKQNATGTLNVSVLSYFRRPMLDCGQREGSRDI